MSLHTDEGVRRHLRAPSTACAGCLSAAATATQLALRAPLLSPPLLLLLLLLRLLLLLLWWW